MRLLIFGATGKTGRQLLAQGLKQGFVITAFVRNATSLPVKDKNLSLIQGNIVTIQVN